MEFRELDKKVLKSGNYTVVSRLTLMNYNLEEQGVFSEEDCLVNWTYEDYRYVPDTGFIGQFVERILDGKLKDLPSDTTLENKVLKLELGIVNGIDNTTTYYDYGLFLITNVKYSDTNGEITFESSDMTKLFNKEFDKEEYSSYPCIAGDMANRVCSSIGVELGDSVSVYYHVVTEDDVNNLDSNGKYNIIVGTSYKCFTRTEPLKVNDVILFYNNSMWLNSFSDGAIVRNSIQYTTSSTLVGTNLWSMNTTTPLFTNFDFPITEHKWDGGATCRDIMKDIGKIAYSWVRIGTDNKCHIDFEQMSTNEVDYYDRLTTNEYYTSKKADYSYGEVNRVLVGLKDVDGENVYKVSSSWTTDTDCCIQVFDNNITNTQELRQLALNGSERLFGLTYMPLEINTIGHPWLEGDELIELTNVDGDTMYMYPFNRKLEYTGILKGYVSSYANTITEQEYEYDSDMVTKLNKTTFEVDKANGKISLMSSLVEGDNSKLGQLSINYGNIEGRVSKTERIVGDSENGLVKDVQKLSTDVSTKMDSTSVQIQINKTLEDGVGSVKTSTGFVFNDEGLTISKTGSEMSTNIDEDGMSIYRNSTEVLRADNQGVTAFDLHATTFLIVGTNSRFENYDNGSRTGCFWIG